MKCQIPQIVWHSRDPVLSIDFQPMKDNRIRLASGGTDSHVVIWYITYQENKSVNIEFASDLYRHNKSVNVVRFSPNGDLLASGDDEGALFIWQIKEKDTANVPKDEDNINQEEWYPVKLLRGHLEDVYDISWSADGNSLVTASMDNTAIVWDIQKFQKIHTYTDPKGYVQGVSWDPLNSFIATIGTDRCLRIMNVNTKKTIYRIKRASWNVTTEKGSFRARLFYDDTLKSYFRRLSFTPDGELLIVPSGILEKDGEKISNTVYLFSRHCLNKPVAYLPTGDKYTVAVRCSPLLYKLRGSEDKENKQYKQLINLPYRMLIAVVACDSVIIYDTEQLIPIAKISNIHYTHLTDLSWSADGRILVASSTDGYCSFIVFNDEELGEVYIPPPPSTPVESPIKEEPIKSNSNQNSVKEINLTKNMEETEMSNKDVKPVDGTTEKNKNSVVVSPSGIKPKKPRITIENFFKSPKAMLTSSPKTNSCTSRKLDVDNVTSDKDEVKINEEIKPKSNESTNAEKSDIIMKDAASANTDIPMDIDGKVCDDSCSIEIISELKADSSKSSKKDPNCELQLNFANKIHVDASFAVNPPDSIVIEDCASKSHEESAVPSETIDSDWKLELSQDEDIMPMDTMEPSTSASEVKSTELETTPKPKRRINLITLSKTVSGTPPKL